MQEVVVKGRRGSRSVQTDDRSVPIIEPGVVVRRSSRAELLQEITRGRRTSRTVVTNDRSEPMIDPGTRVRRSSRQDLLAQVRSVGGVSGIANKLERIAADRKANPGAFTMSWKSTRQCSTPEDRFVKVRTFQAGPPPKRRLQDLP
eukprot:jgi/Chlat1/6497/Chrsp45S05989